MLYYFIHFERERETLTHFDILLVAHNPPTTKISGHPPEEQFLAKIKAIPGVSQVETQTITNMII